MTTKQTPKPKLIVIFSDQIMKITEETGDTINTEYLTMSLQTNLLHLNMGVTAKDREDGSSPVFTIGKSELQIWPENEEAARAEIRNSSAAPISQKSGMFLL